MKFKENTFYNSRSINQKIIILIHKGSDLNVLDEEGRSLSKAIKTILLMILRLGVISMCIHECIRIPTLMFCTAKKTQSKLMASTAAPGSPTSPSSTMGCTPPPRTLPPSRLPPCPPRRRLYPRYTLLLSFHPTR